MGTPSSATSIVQKMLADGTLPNVDPAPQTGASLEAASPSAPDQKGKGQRPGTPSPATNTVQQMLSDGALPNVNPGPQMRASFAASLQRDPDQEGKVQRLAAATHAGIDVTRQNYNQILRNARIADLNQRNIDFDNALLAEQLADPNFAAIGHDQLDNLQQTGSLFQQVKGAVKDFVPLLLSDPQTGAGLMDFAQTPTGQDLIGAYKQGRAEHERGELGLRRMKANRQGLNPDDAAELESLQQQIASYKGPSTLGGRLLGGFVKMGPELPKALAVGAAGAVAGGAIGGLSTGGLGIIPGAMEGAELGFNSQFAVGSAEIAMGNAYLDMQARGVSEHRAQLAATAVGLINLAVQAGTMHLAEAGLSPAMRAFNGGVAEETANALTRPTIAQAVKTGLSTWGKHTALGVAEMGVMQPVLENVANNYADRKSLTTDLGRNVGKSMVNALIMAGTMNAFTGMVGFTANANRAAMAERSSSFFESLSQNAAESKVRERNPDAYEQFIANQAQGTGAETVYIDGKQMGALVSKSRVDPAELEQAIPGINQQIADAASTGGDVQIPISQYAARLAGTPLGDAMKLHIRLDPDAMSATEAIEFYKKQQELFKQTQSEAAQQMASNEAFAQSAKVVENDIFEQIKATKTMPDDKARTNAQFVRDFVVTQAAREGMSPEDFYNRYKYSIQLAAGDLRGKLAQSFIQSPDGEYHFGEITPEIGQAIGSPAGKIRLTPERLEHLNEHLAELGIKGFSSAQEFARYVGDNFKYIYKRESRDGQHALDLVTSDPVHGRMIVTLKHDPDGHYYNIETAHPARQKTYKNKQPLWERTELGVPSAEADSLFPKASSETKAVDDIIQQSASSASPHEVGANGSVSGDESAPDNPAGQGGDSGTLHQSSPHEVDAGAELARKIEADPEGVEEEYNHLPGTDGGRILDTDQARELSEHYRADRSRSSEVQKPAGKFIRDLFAKKLARPVAEGREPLVLFTAGGSGAGKSMSLTTESGKALLQNADIVYDTNMGNFKSADKMIQQALNSGRNVAVRYTFRDPVEALTRGVLPRAMETGRTVPLEAHEATHVGSRKAIEQLAAKYAGDPRVSITAVDNSGGIEQLREVNVDDLPTIEETGLKERLQDALNQEHAAGRISDAVRDGTAGRAPGATGEGTAGRADQEAVQRTRVHEGSRPGTNRQYEAENYAELAGTGGHVPGASGEEAAGQEAVAAVQHTEVPEGSEPGSNPQSEAESSSASAGGRQAELQPDDQSAAGGPTSPEADKGTLHQSTDGMESDDARGGFSPSTLTTLLGKKADMSTFLHETAHYFLSVYAAMAKDAESSAAVKADFDKLLNWFGVKDQATWHGMSLEEQRKYHEQFAYNYELYLAEGKAPSLQAQGMFNQFSQWLKRVYKSIRDDINTIYYQQHGEDLPLMTGEVRSVMDRLLASEEQIKQAQATRNMEALFKSQEHSGMNDAEWKSYQEMARAATESASGKLASDQVREMQWLSNAKGRLLKTMQARHELQRDDIRAEVHDELVQKNPVYSAQQFLRTGVLSDENGKPSLVEEHQMDAEAAKQLLPEGKTLEDLPGMTKKGGLSPDEVAAMHEFPDGKSMIDAIVSSPSLEQATESATEQRMLAEHGEMSSPEGMATAVEKAVHNEARTRLIASELRHAARLEPNEQLLVSAARATARKMIEQEKVSDVNPSVYAAQEARAARQAQSAASRGDAAGIGRAKQDQLLQNALVSEAIKVKAEAKQHLRFLKQFESPLKSTTKAIGDEHMDAINELLSTYGLAQRERYSQRKLSLGQWLENEYSRTGVMPAVAENLTAPNGPMSWKNLTAPQLRELRDAVKSLEYTGRERRKLFIAGKQEEVDGFVDDVIANLADMKHTAMLDIRQDLKSAKGLNKLDAKFLRLKSMTRSFDAARLKMEQFFQWIDAGKDAGLKDAPIHGRMQSLFRLVADAENQERAMRDTSRQFLKELGESLSKAKIDLREVLEIPELPREGNRRWYRSELLAVALNMGNQSTKEKLLRGYNWTEGDVVSAIHQHLSAEEVQFIQSVWEHLSGYAKKSAELQRRQLGVTPQPIEATPLETKHGTLSGGYYPVVYNDVLSPMQEQTTNAARLFENNYAAPSTASGRTASAADAAKPLYLDLNVVGRHIDQLTHDLAWREPIVDMNKVLTDERMLREIEQVYGREYSKQLRPWLQAMANDKVFDMSGNAWWENTIRASTSSAKIVALGSHMTQALKMATIEPFISLGEVRGKWSIKGWMMVANPLRFKETRQFVFDRSPEMANRLYEADRVVHEAIQRVNMHQSDLIGVSAAQKLADDALKFAFWGVGQMDMISALPTWMGAYLKGLSHVSEGGLGLGEQDAIAYADRAVRNAHGGGGVKDMAAVQRSESASAYTMFYSFWSHMYTQQRDLAKGWGKMLTGQAAVKDFPRLLAKSWFYFAVLALAYAKSKKKKKDDRSLSSFLKNAAEDLGDSFLVGVPGLHDLVDSWEHGAGHSSTPSETIRRNFVIKSKDLAQGNKTGKSTAKKTGDLAGYATGMPLSQPYATGRFLWDVMDGQSHPKDVADWWKGVSTGNIHR